MCKYIRCIDVLSDCILLLALQTIQGAAVAVYWINFFFTFLFSLEAVLKITALHPVVQ